MTTIYAIATDQVLTATILPKVACSNQNTVKLHVDFDASWNNYAKSAVFFTNNDATRYEVVFSGDGNCFIPAEVLAERGRLCITVKGVNGNTVKSSTELWVKILAGTPTMIISDPTANVYNQLLNLYNVVQARVTALASLEEGSTTGDAELADIRISDNGETYASAGSAVRGQVSGVRSLFTTNNFVPLDKNSPLFEKLEDKYVNGLNGIATLAEYTISYFTTEEKTNFWLEIEGTPGYISLAVFNGGINGTVTKLYRDTLPTAEAPVEVDKGLTVAISHRKAIFKLHHNSHYLGYKASDRFNLGDKLTSELQAPLNNLIALMADETSYLPATKDHSDFTYINGYIDGKGVHIVDEANPYSTYYFTAKKDFSCYFTPVNGYVSLAHFRGNFGEDFTARYRYNGTENTLPYVGNPFSVKKGDTIAISCDDSGSNFALMGNNSAFGLQLTKDVYLDNEQISKIFKKPLLKYANTTGESYSVERLFIYLPTVVGYVGYEFAHVVSDTINADNWRILRAFACDNKLNKRFNITSGGEWEMAIKILNRTDFIGGSLHGDEKLNNISFIVDGVKKQLSELTELTAFNTLRIIENTQMYDPNDNTTLVATHGKEYIFTSEGLNLRQFVKWITSQIVTTSYMAMLPIYRGNDENSTLQVTDTYYCDDDFIEYDVSVAGDYAVYAQKKGVRKATIYSNKSGVCASVEIKETPDLAGGGYFQVSGSEQYNKLYFACAGYRDNHNVAIGDKWVAETAYKISVNEGTDV